MSWSATASTAALFSMLSTSMTADWRMRGCTRSSSACLKQRSPVCPRAIFQARATVPLDVREHVLELHILPATLILRDHRNTSAVASALPYAGDGQHCAVRSSEHDE